MTARNMCSNFGGFRCIKTEEAVDDLLSSRHVTIQNQSSYTQAQHPLKFS